MIVNKGHEKAIYVLLVCSIVGMIMFMALWGYNTWDTKDYIPIEAEIIGLDKNSGTTTHNQHHVNKSIVYAYQYKGKEYTAYQRVLVFTGKHEGDIRVIYMSPDNPEEIKDTFTIRMYMIFTFFCFALVCLTGRASLLMRGLSGNR